MNVTDKRYVIGNLELPGQTANAIFIRVMRVHKEPAFKGRQWTVYVGRDNLTVHMLGDNVRFRYDVPPHKIINNYRAMKGLTSEDIREDLMVAAEEFGVLPASWLTRPIKIA